MGSVSQHPDKASAPQAVRMPPWDAALVHYSGGRPVYIDPEVIPSPKPIDATCGCGAGTRVLFDVSDSEKAGIIAVCMDHADGCQRLADMAAIARRPR